MLPRILEMISPEIDLLKNLQDSSPNSYSKIALKKCTISVPKKKINELSFNNFNEVTLKTTSPELISTENREFSTNLFQDLSTNVYKDFTENPYDFFFL